MNASRSATTGKVFISYRRDGVAVDAHALWRRDAAGQLVDVVSPLLDEEPTDRVLADLSAGLQARGHLRIGTADAWDLCLRLLRHDRPE